VYGKILERIETINDQLVTGLYQILGYKISPSSFAKALLKFQLLQTFDNNIFIPKAFPVSSLKGIMFLTDEVLVIPTGSTIGYVNATAIISGEAGNVEAYTINNPRQILSFPVIVTNESKAFGGSSQQSLESAQRDLAIAISNSTVINASNYLYRLNQVNPNYFGTVYSPSSFNVAMYIGKKDGTIVLDSEISELSNYFNSQKHIGLETITINKLNLIPLYIEAVIAVDDPISFSESEAIATSIRDYLTPGSEKLNKHKGIVILENLKRIINPFPFDYIQTMRIGTSINTAVGNNFVYNPNTESVFLRMIRVTLINDDITNTQDFNYG
jgi:hypothetical protein